MTVYDFSVRTQDGSFFPLKNYRDKVLLIVNTATSCGFTPQYKALENLYKKYKAEGFEILDFPCDQFAHQAPGSDEDIHAFCTGRFGITFPQFSKIKVNGMEADPLYKFLKKSKGTALGNVIKWNFTKFLVSRNGTVVRRYAPSTTPESIEKDIVSALDGK